MRPAPHIYINETEYTSADGRKTYGIYNSLTARLHFVPIQVKSALKDETGQLLAALPDASRSSLADLRLSEIDSGETTETALARMEAAATSLSNPIMVLLPGSYCNMGCTYCGQEHRRGTLIGPHRDAVRDRVLRKIAAATTETISVRWFGAEPLMSYAVIKYLAPTFIAAATSRGIPYSSNIVTNGALLDQRKLSFLIERAKVTEYHITLDGWGDRHDAHRPLKSGKSSFHKIVDIIAWGAEAYPNASFFLRTNVDVDNSEFVAEYLCNMAESGFSRRPNVVFHLTPVRSWGNYVSAVRIGTKRYAEMEEEWLLLMERLGLNTVLVPTSPKSQPCPAVSRSSEVLTSDGGVFSCTEHPLVPQFDTDARLANISEYNLPLRPVGEFDQWHNEVRQGETPCRTCWFMPSCAGSCPKLWHEGEPACPSIKFNMSARIDIAANRLGYTVK